jgi:hypothetical protein
VYTTCILRGVLRFLSINFAYLSKKKNIYIYIYISVEIACVQAGDSKLRCVPCVTHYDEHLGGISFLRFLFVFSFLVGVCFCVFFIFKVL